MAPTKRTLVMGLAAALMGVAVLSMAAGRLFVAGVLFLTASMTLYAAETYFSV
ncbi:hypothetical protein [Halomarina litorea]|uniref:hypothetical protein n=1 Tax=Halomarina litorea TaxID=2961595 RepID=UPI0020C44DF5|nr:hypothetical protein [Halomarina sp. BCD28]